MTDDGATPGPKRPAKPRATRPATTRRTAAAKPAAPKAAAKPAASNPAAAKRAAAKPAAPKRAAPKPAAAKPAASKPAAATPSIVASQPVQLYLLRHADAGDSTTWPGDDAVRPLSPKGRRQARRLGRLLADLGFRPDVLLTSPKLRALQTARIVGRLVGVRPAADDRLGESMSLADLGGLLAGRGAGRGAARRVVLVGHDPDFSSIASALSGAAIDLRKGALVRIDLPDSHAVAGGGSLRWLIPPGALPG